MPSGTIPDRSAIAKLLVCALLATGLTACAQVDRPATEEEYADQRASLATLLSKSVLGRTPISNGEVLRAMATVPRHRFVPESHRRDAYKDYPLPIGHEQTISQPYVVARMTEALALDPDDVVLEIGTGSGYQAAVLAELCAQVYTIEIVEPLGESARSLLEEIGYDNIEVRIGDGYQGWPERAPFDAIIVTAAPPFIPDPLVEQLKPGARMVIPVGEQGETQELLLIEKQNDGSTSETRLDLVRFVPMTGEAQAR